MDALLECSICLNPFTDPITTSCGHNFCKPCFTFVKCPVCRAELKANSYSTNFQLKEIAEAFKKFKNTGSTPSIQTNCIKNESNPFRSDIKPQTEMKQHSSDEFFECIKDFNNLRINSVEVQPTKNSGLTPQISFLYGQIHHNVKCDECLSKIVGLRYKCSKCKNFDLCHKCYGNIKMRHSHVFTLKTVIKKNLGVKCDSCGQNDFEGRRWKCSICPDFDFCNTCFLLNLGIHTHRFFLIND